MSNEYFNPASVPAPNAPGASAVIRGEFASIAAAFDKMPVMAGSANEFVVVNPTGTGLIASGFSATDIATTTGIETLTNKTLSWGDNTWVGFGTAATKEAGTGAGEVLLLTEADKLPSLDGSNLINLNPANLVNAQAVLGIDQKANANNAVLTGAPVATTASAGNNSTRIATTAFVTAAVVAAGGVVPSNTVPAMSGVASAGTSTLYSRGDHIHPVDTSRAPAAASTAAGTSVSAIAGLSATDAQAALAELVSMIGGLSGDAASITFTPAGSVAATDVQAAIEEVSGDVTSLTSATSSALALKAPLGSPAFTGTPTAPTPDTDDNDTSIATTAFVQAVIAQQPAGMQASDTTPEMNGVASAGTGVEGSRFDHIHPTDTSRAPLASPALTGTPTAPTAAAGTNTTQLATTAFVHAERTNTATLTGKTLNLTGNTLVATSAQMAAAVSDKTGSGALVFAGSPALTGTPTAPTAAGGTNTTQLATTAFVQAAVAGGAGVTSVVGQTGAVTATQVRDALLAVDGAASGLDADLLDGQHASAFAAAVHSHSLASAGGTTLVSSGLTLKGLVAGSGITLSPSGTTITISSPPEGGGACLHPHSVVRRLGGQKFVCDVRPGDVILGPNGWATVAGVWESVIGDRDFFEINGAAVLTGGHLVRTTGGWAVCSIDEYTKNDFAKDYWVKTLTGLREVPSGTLSPGDLNGLVVGMQVFTENGPVEISTIRQVRIDQKSLPVYSLVLENAVEFYADGVSVAALNI